MRKLLLLFALIISTRAVQAVDLAPIPMLGENSAYTVTETPTAGENSITTYEIQESNNSYSYTDINGQTVTKEYTVKEVVPHYYDINITAESAERLNNTSTIGDVIEHFISQAAGNLNNEQGGAISNTGTIGNIIGDFIMNNDKTGYPNGGAIFNYGNITSISGDFILNTSGAGGGWGGAIGNESKEISTYIGSITGNFISNTTTASKINSSKGGAIWNGNNPNITNDNTTRIDSINGNFYNNSSTGSGGTIGGGAIANAGMNASIGSISGIFVNNHVFKNDEKEVYQGVFGGAVYNDSGQIESISADFIQNYAYGDSASGGAIYNKGNGSYTEANIKDLNSNFYNNSAKATNIGEGGAIHNEGVIDNIRGLYYGNSASASYQASGGAISNDGYLIDSLSTYSEAPNGYINNINADFIDNTAISNGIAIGGAISNGGVIGNIEGTFHGNTVKSGESLDLTSSSANSGTSPYGSATQKPLLALGGGIENEGYINTINADFVNNSAILEPGGIQTMLVLPMPDIKIAAGGAIFNYGNIGTTQTTDGKNIMKFPVYQYKIYNADGTFAGTYVNTPVDEPEFSEYIKEQLESSNSAINISVDNIELTIGKDLTEEDLQNQINDGYLYEGTVEDVKNDLASYIATDTVTKGGIVNSSFINNYASGEKAYGGAIYTGNDLTVKAENGGVSLFKGNYTLSNGVKDDNAIYVESGTTLTLSAETNGTIQLDDKIGGGINNYAVQYNTSNVQLTGYNVKVTGDSSGKVIVNNNIEPAKIELDIPTGTNDEIEEIRVTLPANIQLEKTNLLLATRDNVLDGNNLQLDSGYLGMINNGVGVSALNNLTVNGDTKMGVDVDLANKEMDRFTAKEYGSHTGNVTVTNVNLLSDADPDERVTAVYFAEPGLKTNVKNGIGTAPNAGQTTVYSPIYKYDVSYDNINQYDGKGDGGYFLFSRGGGAGSGSNPSDAFNPAVLNSPVSSLAAGQATINETFKYAFEHADAFTQLPAFERMAKIKQNYYALSTDYNENLGELALEFYNKAGWVRPYVTFESMNLKNGPDVDAITYGTLVGFDSDFQKLKNGWYGVTTGYVGYNGSQLSYSGNDTSMNGGLLGVTQTFYKGNFWTALTASAGASVGETSNMYGTDEFVSLLAGVGSKTGYNFEFKEGKFILQPIMFLSYTFVNTFDYTNAAGVKIESDPLHTIQLNPSIRFIANLENGWQPYASVGMVWNLLNQTETTANNIALPQMHIRPYIEYGLGIQKRWADQFTGYLQAMIRNGGRNGIAITGGLRWNIGKVPAKNINSDKPKTVIKSLNHKVAEN